MPATGDQTRSSTAEAILDSAQALIQSRGYSAISYQDISLALGIRKASIHHHFPTKADLGAAVIERYAERFEAALAAIDGDRQASAAAMLDRYFGPFRALAATPDQICLCGALAGEMPALSPALRERVDRFFTVHHDWLAALLRRGAERGEFRLAASAERTARLVFDSLQGALIVRRTTGDPDELEAVIGALLALLAPTRH